MKYKRGNHSDAHVLQYGKVIYEGNVTEVKNEISRMRKFCRDKWYVTSTNNTLRDFVEYEMGDIWAFKVVDGQYQRIY